MNLSLNKIKKYKIALSTILLILISNFSVASNEMNFVVVSGQVTNMEYGNPVEGHPVYIVSDSTHRGLVGYSNMIITNDEGYYIDTIYTTEDKGSLVVYTFDHYGESIDTTVHFRFIDRGNSVIIANFSIFLPYQAEQLQAKFKYFQKSGGDKNRFSFFDQTNNNNIISWHWDFGDGTSSATQNPIHVYSTHGLYKITFTVTAMVNNMPKTSIITQQVYITDREYYHLGGHVFSEYFPIDLGYAFLYMVDSLDNYIPIDTISFDTLGYYYFYQIPQGKYLVKVEPMRDSEYYGILLPTYYGDKLFWDEAELIELNTTSWEYDIVLSHSGGIINGGGSISGNIEYIDLPRSVKEYNAAGVNIYLFDDLDNLLTYHYSDEEGNFIFDLLELNTYWLYPEVTGIHADRIRVELTPETPDINIEITIQANGISYVLPDEGLIQNKVVGLPYPNPVSGTLNIPIDSAPGSKVSYVIFDAYGHTISSKEIDITFSSNSYQVNTTSLKNGSYILRTRVDDVTYDQVFIVVKR